ncbi:nicotinate-nucleotide adenylyltransferase [Halomonas shantousis]
MSVPEHGADRHPRVAMMGGTFDPVHLGHLRSAVELGEALALDRIHMVPAHVPPHREAPGVSSAQRLAMLEAGIGDTPRLIADGRELDRDGPSYSVDTLALLRDEIGSQGRLVMALGHDAFIKLHRWHEPKRLFELAHVVVIDRPDHEALWPAALIELIGKREVDNAFALMREPAGRLLRLRLSSRMAISATGIRQRLQRGGSVRYLLPEAVERYIVQRRLYA